MFFYDITMVNGSLEYRIYTIYYSTASAMPLLYFLFFFNFSIPLLVPNPTTQLGMFAYLRKKNWLKQNTILFISYAIKDIRDESIFHCSAPTECIVFILKVQAIC